MDNPSETSTFSKLSSPFINLYLEYVEPTESPRIMHVWCAIATAAACLGRRVYLPSGVGNLYPNLYTVLVGPPGSRKSTAINLARALTAGCNLNFAPDDTGGQRQGLIKAIVGAKTDEEELAEQINAMSDVSAENIAELSITLNTDARNQHTLFVCASEITSLWGQDVGGMLPFFNKIFDGEEFKYSLARETTIIKDGLMTILGATTTSQIKTTFPQEATGQGFMSRCLFVYGAEPYRDQPEVPPLDEEIFARLAGILEYLAGDFEAVMSWEPEGYDYMVSIYREKMEIQDARFVHYEDRRHMHFKKICIVLAALRNSTTISLEDCQDAHRLLKYTEQFMPDALGEYGMSPLSAVKQKVLEFLQHHNESVPTSILFSMVSSDVKLLDFHNCMSELINADKISLVRVDSTEHLVIKRSTRNQEQHDLFNALGG